MSNFNPNSVDFRQKSTNFLNTTLNLEMLWCNGQCALVKWDEYNFRPEINSQMFIIRYVKIQ